MTAGRRAKRGSQPEESRGGTGLAWLEEELARRGEDLTPAERAIAAYVRDNLSLLPFETGASIAASIGVSQMTVIRFVRSLGYGNLKDFKEGLRARFSGEDQAVDDVLERFRVQGDGFEHLRESLELQIRAVVSAYALAGSPRWQEVVELIAGRRFVYVVGFQATRGTALDFATRLKYAREGVRFAEGSSGVYSEVLDADPTESCLVVIDTVAYARKGQLLSRRARELGIPLVVVTDRFSHWAYEFTELVLEGHTHVKTFWDSTASLSVILNLLIDSVASRLGDKAEERFRRLVELGDHFQEFEPVPRRHNGVERNHTR